MRILIFSLIFEWFLINEIDSQCSSDTIPDSLSTLTQYQIGSEGDSYYSHLLANGVASFTLGNVSAEEIYELSAYGISAATTNCTSSCLTSVSAYYKTDSDKLTIIMLRPSDESLYSNYTKLSLPPFYCATISGNCGAKTPLYQFYSSTYDDYYANTEQQNNTNATYSVAMMGLPLCYLWVPLTTTTTSPLNTTSVPLNETTTTVPVNGTTTTVPFNETTTTVPSNETTTTVPINGTTTVPGNATTAVPSNGNVTTTTPSSTGSNATTTQSNSGNSTNSPDDGGSDGSGEQPGNNDGGEKKDGGIHGDGL
uniref:Astacin domain-containing protein n=1 Tax=Caenorhabditis tropicalis TaxID=1561998 RepID=A0A1I7TYQ5_9PELO